MTYGYARVSSKDQNEARQIDAFHENGIADENIVIDKESGKDFDRTQYKKLRRKLKEGDSLVVISLDRFGRNYDMIIDEWRHLTKEKGVTIKVLDMPILNTTEEAGLTGKLVSDIVLQLLSYVAQMERDHIHKRQAEGIAAAKARGVKFGREKMEIPSRFYELKNDWENGLISVRGIVRELGISHITIAKWLSHEGAVQKKKYLAPRSKNITRYSHKKKEKRKSLRSNERNAIEELRREIFAPIPDEKPLRSI